MNSMKRQKDTTLGNEPPRLEGVRYATGEEQRNSSRKNDTPETYLTYPRQGIRVYRKGLRKCNVMGSTKIIQNL